MRVDPHHDCSNACGAHIHTVYRIYITQYEYTHTSGSFMRMNDEACFRRGRSAVDVCNWLRRTVTTNERVHCQPAELLRRNENDGRTRKNNWAIHRSYHGNNRENHYGRIMCVSFCSNKVVSSAFVSAYHYRL